jgi:hypothetical protein
MQDVFLHPFVTFSLMASFSSVLCSHAPSLPRKCVSDGEGRQGHSVQRQLITRYRQVLSAESTSLNYKWSLRKEVRQEGRDLFSSLKLSETFNMTVKFNCRYPAFPDEQGSL